MAKFKTHEEAEAAHAALEQKLGEQGKELGELRKQSEGLQALQATVKQYEAYVTQAKPVLDWYTTNEATIRSWAQSNGQPAQAGAQVVQQQAQQVAQQQPGYEWLTPQEKQAFTQSIAQHLQQSVLVPWTQQFSKVAEDYAKRTQESLDARQRAAADVMWRTLQFVMPPDKIEAARKWHEEAMKYADPSKIDPMQMAQERLDLVGQNETLKQKLKEIETQQEEAAKRATPSLGPSGSTLVPSDAKPEDQQAPQSRDERFRAVMDDVKAQHGPEGVSTMFPALGR